MEIEGEGEMDFSGCLCYEIVWIDGQVGMQFQTGRNWKILYLGKKEPCCRFEHIKFILKKRKCGEVESLNNRTFPHFSFIIATNTFYIFILFYFILNNT